jgi:hypothetical protein
MDDELDWLRGRCFAVEMVASSLMAMMADRFPDPPAAIEGFRAELFASVQMTPRPSDPRSDAAWNEAVGTLNRIFATAAEKARRGP